MKEILNFADSLELSVIPLVQTFGHMEYVLKHGKFAHLREDPDNYMDICPLSSGALSLVTRMVQQVSFVLVEL